MKIIQYYSDDYAGLELGDLKFYYGYEVIDSLTGDWCFQVKKDDKEIYKITCLEIEGYVDSIRDTPQSYLIAGIGIWLLTKETPVELLFNKLTDEQRLELMSNYCKYCGCDNPGCQCWNDE